MDRQAHAVLVSPSNPPPLPFPPNPLSAGAHDGLSFPPIISASFGLCFFFPFRVIVEQNVPYPQCGAPEPKSLCLGFLGGGRKRLHRMAFSGGEVWGGVTQRRPERGPQGLSPGFSSRVGSGLENLSGVGWAPGCAMSVSGRHEEKTWF